MDKGLVVLTTAFAGGLVALQAPINGGLGGAIGKLPAAAVSFTIGTIALILITVIAGGGFGDLGEARHLSWYYLTGGILGAVYVTTALTNVADLGAGGVTAATIAGQLSASVIVDRLGLLGLPEQALTWQRILGIVLLAGGTFLVVRY